MNRDLDEKLSALLDAELPPAEAAALRAELERSPELAARLEAFASVDAELRALPSRGVPPGLRARLARELRSAPAGARRAPAAAPRRGARRWLAAGAIAATAAAVALLALPRAQHSPATLARTATVPAPAVETVEPQALAPTHEEVGEPQDLPVIQVLDVLTQLDELESGGSG